MIPSPKTCPARPRRAGRVLVGALLVALSAAQASPSVPVNPGAPGVNPLGISSRGHFVVRGSANGHPIRLVVDSACPVTIIDSAFYPKLVRPGAEPATTGHTIYPASLGYRASTTGIIADLRVGETPLGRVAVGVTSLDTVLGQGITGHGTPDADGILGSDLLLRHNAVIDVTRATLLLDPSRAQKEDFSARAAHGDYTAVSLAQTSGLHLAAPCTLGSLPYRIIVDTGSPATVVQRGALGSADLVPPSHVSYMRTLSGVTSVAWMPLQNWSVGDFPVDTAVVATGNFQGGIFGERTSNGGQVAGQLGLQTLAHWHALVDFGSRKLYLRRPESTRTEGRNPALTARLGQGSVPASIATSLQQAGKTKSR